MLRRFFYLLSLLSRMWICSLQTQGQKQRPIQDQRTAQPYQPGQQKPTKRTKDPSCTHVSAPRSLVWLTINKQRCGLRVDGSPALASGSVFLNTTSTKNFAKTGHRTQFHAPERARSNKKPFCSCDAKHQCVLYDPSRGPAPQNSSLNNKALNNVGRRWYAWFIMKNKSLYRKHILSSSAEATQPFRQGQRFCDFC
jgi:hypothetical protein